MNHLSLINKGLIFAILNSSEKKSSDQHLIDDKIYV